MDEEEWMKAFVAVATFAGFVVVCGSVHTAQWHWSDWMMLIGSVMGTVGMVMGVLVVFDLSDWLQRHGMIPCLGSIGSGVLLFAMGFVTDQVRYRGMLAYRRQLVAMDEVAKSIAREETINRG